MKLLNRYRPGSKRLPAALSGKSSSNQPSIFLLRHGQIQGSHEKRFIGQTQVPLDHTGICQAEFWNLWLAPVPFARVFSSCLDRCRKTAGQVCPQATVHLDPRLNEIHLGTWENQTFDHVRQTWPEDFEKRGQEILTFRPPGGESFRDLFIRASLFFDTLSPHPDRPVLIVTHSGVIRVMICHLTGRPLTQLLAVRPAYGELFLLGE
jgi:probable phosphoglycerate mutase